MTGAFARKLAAVLLNLILVVLVGGFAAAALVRYSPGFDVDENAWAPKVSAGTRERMHARRQVESRLPVFYARYLAGAAHGDFGWSQTFGRPVGELLRARAAVSLRLIFAGAFGGMVLGGLMAWIAVWPRAGVLRTLASSLNGLLIAIPPAVLALFFFFREAPLEMAVALAVAPRGFGTFRALLTDLYVSPALLMARARGVSSWQIGTRYVLRPVSREVMAFAGVALVMALGCLIPVEALCDVPGIGQLAWKAALSRDLPLLSALALTITFGVSAIHAAGELAQ